MKIYGIWTSDPSHRVQVRSEKNSFRRLGPWAIGYRLSHKSPQSVNPMKSSSAAYRQTDGQTDRQTDRRTKCGQYHILENTLKKIYIKTGKTIFLLGLEPTSKQDFQNRSNLSRLSRRLKHSTKQFEFHNLIYILRFSNQATSISL